MKKLILLIGFILLSSNSLFAKDLVVKYSPPESENDLRSEYFIRLLSLALEKTEVTDGPFRLEKGKESMYQHRAIIELQKTEKIDVLWSMTSIEREKLLLPIRIPLLKGLLGYRILLIREEDEPKFHAIKNIETFKQLTAGQGHDWPDTEILRKNNINVITTPAYSGLFTMLRRKRFDYFPRGINEIWQEIDYYGTQGLIAEKSKMLYYPAPIYFFVSRHNVSLSKRIETGLQLALQDGSFEQLFYTYPPHQKIFERSEYTHRQTFKLHNPLLPEKTPLDNKALWVDLTKLE